MPRFFFGGKTLGYRSRVFKQGEAGQIDGLIVLDKISRSVIQTEFPQGQSMRMRMVRVGLRIADIVVVWDCSIYRLTQYSELFQLPV